MSYLRYPLKREKSQTFKGLSDESNFILPSAPKLNGSAPKAAQEELAESSAVQGLRLTLLSKE
jgi:hypothetical protein